MAVTEGEEMVRVNVAPGTLCGDSDSSISLETTIRVVVGTSRQALVTMTIRADVAAPKVILHGNACSLTREVVVTTIEAISVAHRVTIR